MKLLKLLKIKQKQVVIVSKAKPLGSVIRCTKLELCSSKLIFPSYKLRSKFTVMSFKINKQNIKTNFSFVNVYKFFSRLSPAEILSLQISKS